MPITSDNMQMPAHYVRPFRHYFRWRGNWRPKEQVNREPAMLLALLHRQVRKSFQTQVGLSLAIDRYALQLTAH